MKFNVEIELDWVEPDGSIDEEVRKEIINGISRKINTKSQEEIVKQVEKKISDEVESIISNQVNKVVKDFLNKGVKITDSYGDVKKEIVIKDLLKEKFDKFMVQKVDSKGQESTYHVVGTRFEWIVDDRIKRYCDKKTEKMVADVEDRIKEIFTDELEVKIKDKIVKQIGLEDLISKSKQITKD